ncbi:MAG: ABC transporter substrate-binding protein [Pseudonocardia sp.]
MTTMGRRRVAPAVVTAVFVTLTTACGSAPQATAPGTEPGAAGFPVTVTSCGREVTFDAPPQRIVTTAVGLTDTVFQLGAGDRMVGVGSTAYQQPLPAFAAQVAAIPALGETDTGKKEQVLATAPQLVFAEDSTYPFDPSSGLATVDQLTQAGAGVYISANGCGGANGPVENIYVDVQNLGRILGVQQAADGLVGQLRARVDAAVASMRGTTARVAVLGAGEGDVGLYAIGPRYTQGHMLTTLGLENVFADTPDDFVQVNPEAVIARNPEVIFIGTDGKPATTESKLTFARSVFAHTDAGRSGRIYPLDDAGGQPGSTRGVTQVEQIARDVLAPGAS